MRVDIALLSYRIALYVLKYFGGGGAGIGVGTGESGVESSEGQGLIAEQELFCFHP